MVTMQRLVNEHHEHQMLQGMRSARLIVDLGRQGESTDHHWRLAVDSNDTQAGPEGLVLGDDGNGIVGLDDLDLAEMGVGF